MGSSLKKNITDSLNRRIISDERLCAVIDNMRKHPFILAAFLCFGLTAFGYGSQKFVNGFTVFFIYVILIGYFLVKLLRRLNNENESKLGARLSFCASMLLSFAAVFYFVKSSTKAAIVCIAGFAAIFILYFFLLNNSRKYHSSLESIVLAAMGFTLRFSYILESDIYTRQNDVWTFGKEGGHAGYIEYFFYNNALPDFDPTSVWQFYHPPLHHIISAAWLKFCSMFGLEYYMACEAIQMLSLFYSCVMLILAYKILRILKLEGKSLHIPFGIICFFPYLIIMSGAINNDALSLCFVMGAVYNTLVWYKKQTVKNIVKIAFCIGFGMMSKLSAGLCAPAIALVFLYALIRKLTKRSDLIKQYFVFGVICCPLGLWWGIRNYLRFGVKFTYIPELNITDSQYIGDIPTIKRFTDFGFAQLKNVFEQWGDAGYREFNPTIAFLKNSMFGETINQNNFPEKIRFVPYMLFWAGAVLALFSFLFMILMLFKKTDGVSRMSKLFMTVCHLTILGSYYNFCISYKFICTMNFRYIVPCMFIGAFSIGLFVRQCELSESRSAYAAVKIINIVSCAFMFLSASVYFLLILGNQ